MAGNKETLSKIVLIAFSEIQTLRLGENYGRAPLMGLITDVLIAWSKSRASKTQKLLRALPLLLASRSCLADHQYFYSFYLGKKVAFVYRAHREIRGTKIRVIWGKITRPHGKHKPGYPISFIF